MVWALFADPHFWLAVGQIILINILLSGDNAVVIALACRTLPPRQRLWGMVIGAGIAVVLLIAFTAIIATLMTLPYLKLAGGLALFWIAIKLLVPDDEEGKEIEASHSLWRAVRIVVVADVIMSLDNVIAVAAAAQGSYLLLGLGLAVSIPLIIAGAALIMALLDRFPVIVWAGGALLGWIAADTILTDPVLVGSLGQEMVHRLDVAVSLAGAALVVATGFAIRRRMHRGPIHTPAAVVEAEAAAHAAEQHSASRDPA